MIPIQVTYEAAIARATDLHEMERVVIKMQGLVISGAIVLSTRLIVCDDKVSDISHVALTGGTT